MGGTIMDSSNRLFNSTPVITAFLFLISFILVGCDGDGMTGGPVSGPSDKSFAASTAEGDMVIQQNMDPITRTPLTSRHKFTDDVAMQLRFKPDGRPREVINLHDASYTVSVELIFQPGAINEWHDHPGPVLVAVTDGTLDLIYADDCVLRPYPAGTAFVDGGRLVHMARNPSATENTRIVATFLGVPPTGPLTRFVPPEEASELDDKCGI
jgi:quercetin dioxygenase-like cupin family protein